jgi:hypothetical protein
MEGCPDNDAAHDAFVGCSLYDYYTEGLSYQELEGKALIINSAHEIKPRNHYNPKV